MKSRRDYAPRDAMFPMRGLNVLEPSNASDPRYTPDSVNMVISKGIASKRKGYQPLGAELGSSVLELIEFQTEAGVKHLVAITATKQYRYDTSSDAWVNITYQELGADVDWTGDEEDTISWVIAVGQDASAVYQKWLIVTNGVDQPRYWDGTAGTMLLFEPDIPNFVTCKTLALFYDHLILGNLVTSENEPYNVTWSDTGKLLDFTGANSGAATITDSRGEIVRLLPLADRLIVYSENSIAVIAYVGGSILYSFEQVLSETRLVSPRAIVNIGPYHLFLTEETVVLFDGSRLTRDIGGLIYRRYREELSVELKHRAYAFHDSARQNVYFGIPTANDDTLVYLLEYNTFDITASTWTIQDYTDRPLSMGFVSRDTTLLWNSPSLNGLSWLDVNFAWNQGSTRAGFPTRVIGGTSAVYLADETRHMDGEETIRSYWDTIDFTIPGVHLSGLARWLEIELEIRGNEVDVYYSTNKGSSFTFVEHLVVDSAWVKCRIPIDVVSENLRIRLLNNCPNSFFSFRWLRVWYRATGPS